MHGINFGESLDSIYTTSSSGVTRVIARVDARQGNVQWAKSFSDGFSTMYLVEYSASMIVASVSKDSSAGSGNYNYGFIVINLDASYNVVTVESFIDATNAYLALPKAI